MVDHSLFEADLLTKLRHRPVLLFSRMAKKDRRIAIVRHAKDLFDLRQQSALVVEKIMAVLESVGPGQRFRMCLRVSGLVPGAWLAADDGERICEVLLGIQRPTTPAFSIFADHAGSIFERK